MVENQSIFQILITSDDGKNLPLPPEILDCVENIKTHANHYQHFVLNGLELRNVIANHLPTEVLAAYDGLVPFAYKADLGRYCLLYLFGGWYFDISLRLQIPLPPTGTLSHVIFKDGINPGLPSWDTPNALMFAKKGSPILAKAIEMVVANYQNRWYGTNALCPTGPNLFGRAVAFHGPASDIVTGNYVCLTPHHHFKNFSFVLPDGQILAWGKKTTGTPTGLSLNGLGVVNGNSYSELYRAKAIYTP